MTTTETAENQLGFLDLAVFVLSLYVLLAILADTLFVLPKETSMLLNYIDNAICVFFFTEFCIRSYRRPLTIADDTLVIQNYLIINRCGFQKIRNGQHLPKQFRVKQWKRDRPDAPVIRTDGRHAYWNSSIYKQIR